jgi:hypothetical protein
MTSSYDPLLRPGGDAKALQERLHELISRVANSVEIIKSWPESSGDDASIHVTTTSKLIHSIREILRAIERVEGVVHSKKGTNQANSSSGGGGGEEESALWKTLQNCPIPLDLLEMLDCSNGLNPEIFVRGLLREALSQLAGLRRRKVALEMLGNAIQKGLDAKDKARVTTTTLRGPDKQAVVGSGHKKRERDSDGGNTNAESGEPLSKKMHTDKE